MKGWSQLLVSDVNGWSLLSVSDVNGWSPLSGLRCEKLVSVVVGLRCERVVLRFRSQMHS